MTFLLSSYSIVLHGYVFLTQMFPFADNDLKCIRNKIKRELTNNDMCGKRMKQNIFKKIFAMRFTCELYQI